MLKGKVGLIMGVINERSIAWGVAQLAHTLGAKLAFSYSHDLFKSKVKKLIETVDSDFLHICDVTKEGHIKELFAEVGKRFGKIDFIVHSIAFSDKNELKGKFYDTTLKNFLNSMHISCYSVTEVCREALPFLNNDSSIITMTHVGSQRFFPNYNVMGVAKAALEASVRYLAADLGSLGIRVNAVSPGSIKTLAASGISGFDKFLQMDKALSPMHRNVTQEDIAGLSCFLCSDFARGITGGVHYVDCGSNIMGLALPEEAE